MQGIDRPGVMNKVFEFVYKFETTGRCFEFGVFQGASRVRAVCSKATWQRQTGQKGGARA